MSKRPWTKAEEALLIEALTEFDPTNVDWMDVSRIVGRAPNACSTKYRHMCRSDWDKSRPVFSGTLSYEKAPAHVLDERARRYEAIFDRDQVALDTGNPTAIILGDPPPGRSALDRMRSAP